MNSMLVNVTQISSVTELCHNRSLVYIGNVVHEIELSRAEIEGAIEEALMEDEEEKKAAQVKLLGVDSCCEWCKKELNVQNMYVPNTLTPHIRYCSLQCVRQSQQLENDFRERI